MDWSEVLNAILKYQYGISFSEDLLKDLKFEIGKTGRLRRIYYKNKLIFTLEPTTGFLIPTYNGGLILKKYLAFPKYRVVISDEAVPFVSKGKSVFCKFILNCDPEILPKDLVLVVDPKDNLIATGEAVLSGREMLDFKYGVAVKVKHSKDK